MFKHISCFIIITLFLTISTLHAQTQKPDHSLITNEYIKRTNQDIRKLNTTLKITEAKMYDIRLSQDDRNQAAWDYIVTNIKLFKSDKEIKSIWTDLQKDFSPSLCTSYKKAMKQAENKEVFALEKILYIYLLSERQLFIEQCN